MNIFLFSRYFLTLIFLLFSFVCDQLFSSGFPAGTLVKTKNGFKPIEQIQLHDEVASWDSSRNKIVLSTVEAIKEEPATTFYSLRTSGLTWRVTPDCQFYSMSKKCWQTIDEIEDMAKLFSADGAAELENITYIAEEARPVITYALTVKPAENFFITRQGILVHNWVLIIPIFTWVFGEGIVFTTLTSLGTIFASYALYKGIDYFTHDFGCNCYKSNSSDYLSSINFMSHSSRKNKKSPRESQDHRGGGKESNEDPNDPENKGPEWWKDTVAEGARRKIDEIVRESQKEERKGRGRENSYRYDKKGTYEDALKDFHDLNPQDISKAPFDPKKPTKELFSGKIGNDTLVVRNTSTDNGAPTLEFQRDKCFPLKIRYK